MTTYIAEIQRQLIDVYGFPSRPDMVGVPQSVPDGDYPMTIEGKLDHVRVEGGRIHCMNFQAEQVAGATQQPTPQHGGE